MTLTGTDLGPVGDLAAALGLVDAGGDFQDDWLSNPGDHLRTILADDGQRDALVRFVDTVLGGAEASTDADGLIWLPIVSHDDPTLTVYAVLDAQPTYVGIGVGATVTSSTTPAALVRVHVPVFRAARGSGSVPTPILLGQPGGRIRVSADITVDDGPAVSGVAHLGGVAVTATVPTASGDGDPVISLVLRALQLPGAPAPADLALSLDHLDDLADSALRLVLGLVKAQADALTSGPLEALARLIGLRTGAGVPEFPVQGLIEQGAAALAAWFEGIVASPTSRAAWLDALADLVGAGALVDGGELHVTVGVADLRLGLGVTPGPGGHPTVTPTLRVSVAPTADVRLVAEADLMTLDLAAGSAVALPRLSAYLVAGRRTGTDPGGTDLLTGDPACRAVRAGFGLDAARRPVFLLAADGVAIGTHGWDTLDLTNPDALADAAGAAVEEIADRLFNRLGGAVAGIRVLLGLTPPPGFPAVPPVTIAHLMQDPLAAVRDYWRVLLDDHADAVPATLQPLRDLISDAGHAGVDVTGSGTADQPWVIPLAGPVELQVYKDGGQVQLAAAARYVVDTLGQGCTRVETTLRIGLATLDLPTGHVTFCALVEASLTAAASGADFARFRVGDADLRADHIGLAAAWRPGTGLSMDVRTPNLALAVDGTAGSATVPLVLPVIGPDGSVTLPPEGWDAVEALAALLAGSSGVPWLAHLLDALGWRFDGAATAHHLRLADLVADPVHTLTGWLAAIAVDGRDELLLALHAVARTLTGTAQQWGTVNGTGRPTDPYLVPVGPDPSTAPALALWLLPDGPLRVPTAAGREIRGWRPGMPGLDPAALDQALVDEAGIADEIADLCAGRADVPAGLAALTARWLGTDGRIVPPATDPAGVTVHRVADVAAAGLADAVDVLAVIGHPAPAVLHVAVARPGDDVTALLPGIPADRRIDLRAAGRAPESFPAPLPGGTPTGEWLVLLGGRADCVLPAGDPDGIVGQADRLRRVLDAFGPATVTVLARAEAGHATLRALADQAVARPAAATDLVTLGTSWGPVAFTVVDDQPAADTLRLLHRLLPAVDPAEPDDPDLALGRGLVDGLVALAGEDDPGRELRPPAAGVTLPAGVAVHAVFGVAGAEPIARALTAVFAAGLSTRAQARAAAAAAATPAVTGVRVGLRLPVAAGSTGLTAGGTATLELAGVDIAPDGTVSVAAALALRARLELRRTGGWLVGGPDPGRGPGPRPGHDLRWAAAEVVVPVSGAGPAGARLVLHESRVFGIERERWVVTADAVAAATVGLAGSVADTVTPTLPEVRVLLSDLAAELGAAATGTPGTPVAGVVGMLAALDLVAPGGGALPDGIDHLLHDPAAHLAGALTDAGKRAGLQAALTGLLATAGLDVDLAARSLTVALGGSPGDVGLLPWTLDATFTAGHRPEITATLGTAGSTPAGGAVLRLASSPSITVDLDWHRPGAAPPQVIPLWPAPDIAGLTRGLAYLVPTELGRIGLGYLRALDPSVTPLIDAALDAIGLLGPATPDGRRRVRSPAGLVADPVGWFSHAGSLGGDGALSATKVIALLDALKPILGVTGGPGEWQLTTGVVVRAGTRDGHLELAAAVDTGAFAPIPTAAGRLVAAVAAGLTLAPGGPPRPAVEISVGLAGGPAGTSAVHVRLADSEVTVFLRPPSGPDIPLYPDPPGLGTLVTEAVQQALPLVLDALADLAPQPGFRGDAGRVVAAIGDLLALRESGHFVGSWLTAWAADPAGNLRAALLTPGVPALTAVRDAVNPLLTGVGTVAVTGGALTLTVREVTVSWQPNPFVVTISGGTDLPGVGAASATLALDPAGLRALELTVGPAAIDAGGVILRPYLRAAVGAAPAGGRAVELGLSGGTGPGATSVAARWHLDGIGLELVVLTGAVVRTAPEQIALALVDLLVDLVAGFVLGTDAVTAALDTPVGASTVRAILTGPVLQTGGGPPQLVDDLFDPAQLLTRLLRLAANLAAAQPTVTIADHLRIGLTGGGGRAGVTLQIDGRVALGGDDVVVWLEADTRWVQRPDGSTPSPGLSLFLLDTGGPTPAIEPGIEIGGVGIRVGRTNGPLLDLGLTLGSVAVHGYGSIGGATPGAGVQVQLSDLAVGVGGAGTGDNKVAEGVLRDAGTGSSKLAPAFSPAVAVQRHGTGPVLVSVSAGDGAGPWWLSIQKGFGPVYIEQVGFGVTVEQQQLQRISLLLDGRVSLFGLTAAVDDLQLFYAVPGGGSIVDPRHWGVDLAGFAFGAEIAGVSLEGGLRKFAQGANVEYVGMLIGRFAAYGLSVYGGYGTGVGADGVTYASFFAFGAVNGPIGGPPAFFITGIGGGLGINRELAIPTDMSRFGDFVFIKALDPAARPTGDPMAELQSVRAAFPMRQGEIWFAAGISFNSFTLVDGIAVLSIAVGDGVEIALLGLARMALPRPQLALVSIELGLVVRFSSSEGVLWIQAQLTDNSWLLHESVRLTGGFAFVTWYKGRYAGQFVLTMGGYHPHFHRDGYPDVPRLGFRWAIDDNICIKGESYFALTSEALMAGGRLEASAEFGPAWAHIVFGADGIVYFDPFRFELDIYARISAGVTIDVWIGEITISISIGAELHLAGPKFHGTATFSVGPIGITVPFGDTEQNQKVYLDWAGFLRKYLEEGEPGRARAISAITGHGTLAPAAGENTADGSAARPFVVYSEFELVVTTTVPTATFVAGPRQLGHGGAVIGIAPMNVPNADTRLTLSLLDPVGLPGTDQIGNLQLAVSAGGGFPIGVWGPPQPDDDRKVPSGDVIKAIDGATFTATAALSGTLPTPVNYFQVEVGTRKPLPFVPEAAQRTTFITGAGALAAFVAAVPAGQETRTAQRWLAAGGASRLSTATFARDHIAPPLLGSLSEGFLPDLVGPVGTQVVEPPAAPPADLTVHPPLAIGLLAAEVAAPAVAALSTSVSQFPDVTRAAGPDLTALRARTGIAVPVRLVRQAVAATPAGGTAVATGAVPLTRAARGSVAAVSGRLAAADAKGRLTALTVALDPGPGPIGVRHDAGTADPAAPGSAGRRPASPGPAGVPTARRAADSAPGAQLLRPGELAVLQLPNAGWDTDAGAARPRLVLEGAPGRVVALAHGGGVLADGPGTPDGRTVPVGTERLAVLAGPPAVGVAGWHGGQQLAYVGWATAVVPGGTVHAEGAAIGRSRDRYRTGWMPGAELVDGATIVTTRFDAPVSAVAVLIDDPLGTEAARGLVLSLAGAQRPTGPDGEPRPPSVVAMGNRSALVYALLPDLVDRVPQPVSVGVATQAGWHLAGVLGLTGTAGDLVGRLGRTGIDGVVRPLVEPAGGPATGLVTVRWLAPDALGVARTPDAPDGSSSADRSAAVDTPRRAVP